MGKNNWKRKNGDKQKHKKFKNHSNRKASNAQFKQFSPRNLVKYSSKPIIKNDLKELDVGIEEFTSNLAGFTGVIKARFSDFHVNEIDLTGRECKLTDQEVPKPEEDEMGSKELEDAKKSLEDIITSDVWEKIDKLQDEKCKTNSIEIDVTDTDKEKRTLAHKTLKQQFGHRIISTTINENDKKFIKVMKSKGKAEMRSRWLWPGEYTYFVVHKENADSIQAASDLAKQLNMTSSCVNYSGTKDKRAKTSQRFCVKKREPTQIAAAAKRIAYMQVGNFEFHNKVLKLGELKGNRFRIVLRHVDGDEDKIIQNLENLQNNGFINYYGLQRFGNSAEIPTYKIGLALLKSDFKEACELILKPRADDHPILKEAREVWWKNRNSAEASAIIGGKKCIEKRLLDGLANYGETDYATSLKKLSRNLLYMYTHSFQSLIWNKIVSRRIKEFGLKLIPGDLIYNDNFDVPCDVLDTIESLECGNVSEDEILEGQTSEFKTKVRSLTEDDISSEKYTIFDMVLPLPGYDITYPSNIVSHWYEDLLKEYDLSSEKLKHKDKTYALAGSYRKVIIKPEKLTWQFKKYDSPTSTLIASDYEKLKGIKEDDDKPDGKLKALLLDFILPGSTYATMALRELLKSDTSSSNQIKLMENESQKHKECCSNMNDKEIDIKDDNDKNENLTVTADKRKNENEFDDGRKIIKLNL